MAGYRATQQLQVVVVPTSSCGARPCLSLHPQMYVDASSQDSRAQVERDRKALAAALDRIKELEAANSALGSEVRDLRELMMGPTEQVC